MSSVRAGLRGVAAAVLTLSWALFAPGCGGDGQGAGVVDPEEQDIAATDTVVFADPGLESAVRAALGQPDGAVTAAAAHTLRSLDASGRGITDLEGIGQLDSLTSLDLGNNGIADVEPLAPLTVLQYLDLADNEIVDLSPLAALTALKVLILEHNEVADLSPLDGLLSLELVELAGSALDETGAAALEERGVEVHWERVVPGPDGGADAGGGDGGGGDITGMGPRIAFSLGGDIWVMDPWGGGLVNLTKDAYDNTHPTWSPDGAQLAYSSERAGNADIFVLRAGEEVPVNLTNHPDDDLSPSWSPDGQRIAFVSGRDRGYCSQPRDCRDLFLMDTTGDGQEQITVGRSIDYTPCWSPDGDRIAFVSFEGGIFTKIMDLDSGQIDTLSAYIMGPDGGATDTLRAIAWEPSWSPVDDQIVYAAYPRAKGSGARAVFTAAIEGARPVQLTEETHYLISWPSWSPDGQQIVFVSKAGLSIMDADGGNRRDVSLGTQVFGHPSSPCWVADAARSLAGAE